MLVTLIAAVSEDGYLSPGTGIPWHLPDDIQHFRSYTAGKPLLVGRRTYQEMIGWFRADQRVFVLTRDADFHPEVGEVVDDVLTAIRHTAGSAQELVVIGGGQIYAAALPWAQRIILTRVHTKLRQGIAFPPLSADLWQEIESATHPADAQHEHAFTITTYRTSTLHDPPTETINSALNL
jgi:dihydrofolate reductase